MKRVNILLSFVASLAVSFAAPAMLPAQDDAKVTPPAIGRDSGAATRIRKKRAADAVDPFEQARLESLPRANAGDMMGMGADMGMDDGGMGGYGMGMGEMEMGMGEMGMDMEMGMGASEPDPDSIFRRGLQLAIAQLREAKTPAKKETLRAYLRNAFQNRYDNVMQKRQKDLDDLKKRVSDLQADLERRVAARDRVISLQMQSVELTAEGLMQIDATPKY